MEIVLTCTPSIATFIGMRQVAQENIQREIEVQGGRPGEFHNVEIEMKHIENTDNTMEFESKE